MATLGRGCIDQIRARVLNRLFFKSILSKNSKKVFGFLLRMNQIKIYFFGNALTPLNHKGALYNENLKYCLKAVFDSSKEAP